ncbi:MAG: TPM domain-containing protein [Pseudomonadota bacterium]
MNTLRRMLRHLFTTTADGRRAFPPAALKAIQAAIASGEAMHRAEVRLIVEPALSLQDVLRGETSRERARELFTQYRIWDTEENSGVLIYINLADHKVEIIADRTIGRLVSAADWQAVCLTMTKDFARGAYQESVLAALDQLNSLLQSHLPADGARENQLSNRPIIL